MERIKPRHLVQLWSDSQHIFRALLSVEHINQLQHIGHFLPSSHAYHIENQEQYWWVQYPHKWSKHFHEPQHDCTKRAIAVLKGDPQTAGGLCHRTASHFSIMQGPA